MMRLLVNVPAARAVDEEVRKIVAEGPEGHFALLPRHVDLVVPLVPGLLSYETPEGSERYVALDGGLLVKCGRAVLVSTPQAVGGHELGRLERIVQESFRVRAEIEAKTHGALDKMQADFIARFIEMERHGG